jgi:hypothetical protein
VLRRDRRARSTTTITTTPTGATRMARVARARPTHVRVVESRDYWRSVLGLQAWSRARFAVTVAGVLALGAWIAWDFAVEGPRARRELRSLETAMHNVPVPGSATLRSCEGTSGPRKALLQCTYLDDRVNPSRLQSFYDRAFAENGWRVCDPMKLPEGRKYC